MGSWRETGQNVGILVFRVLGGAGIAVHGYQKLFAGNIAQFAEKAVAPMGFPMPIVFAYMAALTEFLGGIFLVLGVATRMASAALLFNMSVAFFIAHKMDLKSGELALAYWTMALVLVLTGPGALSLDRVLVGKKK